MERGTHSSPIVLTQRKRPASEEPVLLTQRKRTEDEDTIPECAWLGSGLRGASWHHEPTPLPPAMPGLRPSRDHVSIEIDDGFLEELRTFVD